MINCASGLQPEFHGTRRFRQSITGFSEHATNWDYFERLGSTQMVIIVSEVPRLKKG